MGDIELWIVGQWKEETTNERTIWEFQGVFDSEELAIAACRTDDYFIAPATLNKPLPHEFVNWVGSYYPRLQSKEDAVKA